jgi:hypothetical protein
MPHAVLTMPYSLSRNSSMWSSMLLYWDILSAITILLLILKHQNCKSFKVNKRFKVIFALLSNDRGSRLFLFTQVNMYWGCSSNNELWNRLLLLVLIVHDIPIGGKKRSQKYELLCKMSSSCQYIRNTHVVTGCRYMLNVIIRITVARIAELG